MDILFPFLVLFYCLRSFIRIFIPKRYKSIAKENVVITGSGNGLGRALALRFAKFGANIALMDIDESALKQSQRIILKEFPKCFVKTYVCDITDRQMIRNICQQINEDMGFISILVNNAGVLYSKPILELTDDNIINTFNVNTLSNFWMIRAFLPQMLTKNMGHIVNIASMCGRTGFAKFTDYCGSKHAVVGLHESLFLELSMRDDNNIKLTVVCPSFFDSELVKGVQNTTGIKVQNLNKVADDVIDAVLKDQYMIVIPFYVNIYLSLKAFLPQQLVFKFHQFVGSYEILEQFKGRVKDN